MVNLIRRHQLLIRISNCEIKKGDGAKQRNLFKKMCQARKELETEKIVLY